MGTDRPLIDHHCHGVVGRSLDRAEFESMLSEGGAPAPGRSNFDSPVGLAVRAHCAPVLGLDPHASPEAYLDRRASLGAESVHRLLRASSTATFLVDTGYRGGEILSPTDLAGWGGGDAREVVRLETVAEGVAAGGVEAAEFAERFASALSETVAAARAVALKSVAAYRVGLDFDPAPPRDEEVSVAAGRWLDRGPGVGGWRLDDPVLTRFLLWAAVELGRPIQFHTGFGDADLTLNRVNPVLLTGFIRAVPQRVPIMLLHCYPYHREAGYLATVYPHVYLDVGLALSFVGPPAAGAVLAEAMELAPFSKLLYSSDAFGLVELYHLGSLVFRRALAGVLDGWLDAGDCSAGDAARIGDFIGSGNAARVYGLPRP